jgi:ribonuclease P protein component
VATGRVASRAAFAALAAEGTRGRAGVVRVTHRPGVDPAAVAFAVGKLVGTAVVRNRVRRRLRAAVREVGLADGTWLVAVAPPAATATYQQLRDDLAAAAASLGERRR